MNHLILKAREFQRIRTEYGFCPFASRKEGSDLLRRLQVAYLQEANAKMSRLMKVEIDNLEDVL